MVVINCCVDVISEGFDVVICVCNKFDIDVMLVVCSFG